jgi:2-hydroxychromene-2-carboxylate isomerase
MKTVDFYFDLMSPYAYLASVHLPEVVKRFKGEASFVYHPVDLLAVRLAAGNNGPFNRQIPNKFKALIADLHRWARRYEVPLTMPAELKTARANRGFLWARSQGREMEYLHAAYDAVWGHGKNPDTDETLNEIARAAGLSPEKLLRGIDEPAIVSQYEQETEAAKARGVFGVPVFLVDDQIFWGNDRIEFLEEYISESSRQS